MRSTFGRSTGSRWSSRSGFSGFQSKQTNYTGTVQANPDVYRINDEIADVDTSITTLNSEIKQKTACFESEIKNLQAQIKEAQEQGEAELADMDDAHQQEIEDLQKQQEAELKDLQAKLDKALKTKTASLARRNDTRRIQKEAVIAQLKHQLELLRIQRDADGFSQTVTNQQDQIEEQKKELELQAQVDLLDAELGDVTAGRNEDLARVQAKIDEATRAYEARNKEQQQKIQRYRSEIALRKEQYEDELKAIKSQSEMEKTQLENALRAANDKISGLRELQNKLQDRGSQEQHVINREITELNDAIQQARQKEEEQMEEVKDQLATLRAAQREKGAIEQEVVSLREEIDQLKKENQELRKECARIDNMQYSSRISRYRSFLRH